MKTDTPKESPSVTTSNRDQCWETDSTVIAFGAIADDGREYQFSYAHYLNLIRSANPELENNPKAPRERMEIYFSTGEVVVLGSYMSRVSGYVQKGHLKCIRRGSEATDAHHPTPVQIHSVTVILKENP